MAYASALLIQSQATFGSLLEKELNGCLEWMPPSEFLLRGLRTHGMTFMATMETTDLKKKKNQS